MDDQNILKSVHDDIIDDILYLQDIFSLKLDKINYILINSLFYYFILPLLCGSLISMTKPKIAISTSIYIILSLFHYIKDECFLNVLFSVLFKEKLNKKLLHYMEEYPKSVKNYFFDWNSQKKSNNYTSFTEFISTNFSEPFIKSLIYQTNSTYKDIVALSKKFEKIGDDVSPNSPEYLKLIVEEVLTKFPNSEIDIMTTYHKNMSISTGINMGLINTDYSKESFLKILEETYTQKEEDKLFEEENFNGFEKNKSFNNECRENLYSYLRSKDDTLILLVSILIYTIHKKDISQELLSKAKLLKASELAKSEYDTNRILNEIFSLNSYDTNEHMENLRISRCEKELSEKDKPIRELKLTEDLINPFPNNDSVDQEKTTTITLFYNSFFKKLYSNVNVIQKIYDSDLVDNLLNLLMVEPSFRTITNRIILENIFSLIAKEEGLSFVDRCQLDILNKIYYTYLSNIKLIIINNRYIRETGFELFETEWKNYKIQISSTVEDLISRPYLLIPFNLEDVIEDYPKILRIQKTEVDNFKSNLMVFMTLHDLRVRIYKENELIKMSFPLKLGAFDLELDQTYDLTSIFLIILDIGIELYACKLKTSTIKNFTNYYLIVYQNQMYFGLPDTKESNFALIKYKYALRHLEAQIDRADPRLLNLIVKDKNNYIDLIIVFEDVDKVIQVKKSLEEQRKSSRHTEYILLDSYFDDLISKWKF